MQERVAVELRCVDLPLEDSFLALQEGEALVQLTSTADKDSLSFCLWVNIRPRKDSSELDFGGVFVKGVAGERFFYLEIGRAHV